MRISVFSSDFMDYVQQMVGHSQLLLILYTVCESLAAYSIITIFYQNESNDNMIKSVFEN